MNTQPTKEQIEEYYKEAHIPVQDFGPLEDWAIEENMVLEFMRGAALNALNGERSKLIATINQLISGTGVPHPKTIERARALLRSLGEA